MQRSDLNPSGVQGQAQYTTLNAPKFGLSWRNGAAQTWRYRIPAVTLTFAQMSQQIGQFAAALQSLGVQQDDRRFGPLSDASAQSKIQLKPNAPN
jgi:long-subunit acyl-CoA synthetase (AMP-forming)